MASICDAQFSGGEPVSTVAKCDRQCDAHHRHPTVAALEVY